MKDIINNLQYSKSIKPQTITSTGTGSWVDISGFHSAMAVVDVGTCDFGDANETYTPKLQESNDASTPNDVAAADLDGAFSVIDAAAEDDTVQKVGYKGNKRYLRVVMTLAGTSPSCPLSASIITGNPRKGPVAA